MPSNADDRPAEAGRRVFHILLAEDNPVNQKVVSTYLDRRGHDVTAVTNGRAALDALTKDASFDVVLMDMQMPVLDGLTANAFPEDAERCYAAGMNDFISKPVGFKRLLETMARLTTRSERRAVQNSDISE